MPEIKKDPPYLTVDQTNSQFNGKWVVMRIREMGEHKEIIAGEIVYYSRRHRDPLTYLSRLLSEEVLVEVRETNTPFYIFKAGAFIRLGG